MKRDLFVTTGVVALSVCIGFAQTAFAQESAEKPGASKPADTGSDILVTAQRREERLYDVPLTVRVTTGQEIDQKNLASVRDVIENSPQVSFQQTGDERTDTLSIRGLSSVSNASGVEPDAAIVIDGETLARTMQMNQEALDVDRIEILEGPQGTLFGKNAVAGLVNIVSRGPSLKDGLSGRVRVAVAEDKEYRLKASVNVPLGDKAAAYITAYRSYMGGWEENVHEGEPNGGQSKGWGIRGQLLWAPDDSLKITLRGEMTQKSSGIIPYAFKSLTAADVTKSAASLTSNPAAQAAIAEQRFKLLEASGIYLSGRGGADIVNGTKSYLTDDRNWGEMRNRAVGLTIDKDIGAGSFHYIGTYRYFNLYSNDNEWGVSAPQLTNSLYGLDNYDYSGPSQDKTVQQELRFESNTDGPLSYVVGAFYYYNENYHREFTTECKDAVYGNYAGAGFPNPNPTGAVDNFQCTGGYAKKYSIQDFDSTIKTNNEALFGNVEYKINDEASVFAGARMLWEQQHMTLRHYEDDSAATAFDPADPYGEHSAKDSQHAFIYKVGAKYDFGRVMVYGSYSTGFKGVSWDNYDRAKLARAMEPLAPEKPTQIELGMRGDLGFVDWGVSAYRMIDHHFQARTVLRDPSYQLAVADAGRALTQGIQASINIAPFRGLRVGGSYFYMPKAKLLDDVLFPNKTGFINYKDARLPNAPRNSASAYAQYQFAFPAPGLSSTLRMEYRYRGRQQSVLTLDPLQEVDPYGIFDLYYTVARRNEKWSATIYVKNLMNKVYYQRSYEPAVLGWAAGQMAYLPRDYQRYMGATVNYKF